MLAVARLIAAAIEGSTKEVNIPEVSGGNIVSGVLNMAYFILGILAVAMIIFAGIQYQTANGEPDKAKKAMNTIIFSVVGLIVVIMAFAITNFVVTNVGK